MKDKTSNEGRMSIFNVHLGRKIRDFQQIQKYEKGLNGVTSEKLLDLANVLQVPINFFYEGYDKNVREFENDRQNK